MLVGMEKHVYPLLKGYDKHDALLEKQRALYQSVKSMVQFESDGKCDLTGLWLFRRSLGILFLAQCTRAPITSSLTVLRPLFLARPFGPARKKVQGTVKLDLLVERRHCAKK